MPVRLCHIHTYLWTAVFTYCIPQLVRHCRRHVSRNVSITQTEPHVLHRHRHKSRTADTTDTQHPSAGPPSRPLQSEYIDGVPFQSKGSAQLSIARSRPVQPSSVQFISSVQPQSQPSPAASDPTSSRRRGVASRGL